MDNHTINIKVINRDGTKNTLAVPTDMGLNLMETLKSFEFPVEGTCGGMALCASCHIYIKSNHKLPEMSDDEEAMLSEVNFIKKNSRLGCQISISQEIDGLEIEIAPEQ